MTTAVAVRPALKWGAAVVLAAAGLWAVERSVNRAPEPVTQDWPDSPFSARSISRTYAEAMESVDRGVANARVAADAGRDQWLMHEMLAGQYLIRAQLSGNYDDFAGAQQALAEAFKVAVAKSGPHMMQAKLDFTMHRLNGAEKQLAAMDQYAVPPSKMDQSEMAAMRGDIAFYRGRYDEALALYGRADALMPGATTFRRAIHASRTGQVDRADALFTAEIEKLVTAAPQIRAYLELQRGILDLERGRLDDAMAHFRDADGFFLGHWLIEEHIAEVLTLQGKTAEAEALYRDIVRRTGHPEFIDALAGIAEKRGDAAAAKQLYAQAWALWERRIAQFPEAAFGHAIDHCVAKGDWPCAQRLAEKNHEARPFGEAKVALARALLGNGRAAEARSLIETVLASPWRSADMHRVAAEIYQASGMATEAAEQDRLAKAINPLA
jgi:tetratricopeptide (TPR) repeat protein